MAFNVRRSMMKRRRRGHGRVVRKSMEFCKIRFLVGYYGLSCGWWPVVNEVQEIHRASRCLISHLIPNQVWSCFRMSVSPSSFLSALCLLSSRLVGSPVSDPVAGSQFCYIPSLNARESELGFLAADIVNRQGAPQHIHQQSLDEEGVEMHILNIRWTGHRFRQQ